METSAESEEIEVTLLPEPDEPEEGEIDPEDTYVEGVDTPQGAAGIQLMAAEHPENCCGMPEERGADG